MFDGVLVQLAVDGLQEKRADVLVNQLVSEILVETEVGEVAAALSVVLQVLGILQHIDHEVNSICRGNLRVAMQYLGDVGQTSGCIE